MTSSPAVAEKALQVLADLKQIESALTRIQLWAQQLATELDEAVEDVDNTMEDVKES